MTIPCKRDCPDRSAECHGSCEKYREFKAKMDEARARRFADAEIVTTLFEGRHRRERPRHNG